MLRVPLALALVALFLPLLSAHRRTLLVHLHLPFDPLAFPQSPSLSRAQRRLKVHETASHFVQDAQLCVSSFIRAQSAQNVQVFPLWIQNTLVVRYNEDNRALDQLLTRDLWTFPGVVKVEEDARVLTLLRTQQEEEIEKKEEVQSNVKLLHAPELWARGGRGDGVVVASIDSGVRYTHEALRETFRGTKADGKVELDYAFWFTPGTDVAKETPDTADEVGHGTHTMGSAIGGKGVGVAPGATWITARAFDVWGAANKSDFLLAAQWVVCPTRMDGTGTDCSLGADVVTNSFGVDRSTPVYPQWTWLSKVIDAWRAAGVYPVFASGNTNGFLCGSVYYPGSHEDTITVGALIGGSSLWGASGKGPSLDGKRGFDNVLSRTSSNYVIKPDFVAPGVGIRSSMSIGDSVYTRLTGTSMSTPHVAGAIALLLGLNHTKPPAYEKILHGLTQTTTRTLHKPFLVPSACGNTTYHEYPNNIYGWGLPNVCLAANYLGFSCGESIVSGNNLTGEQQLVARADVVAIE